VALPGRGPFFGLLVSSSVYVYYTDWQTHSLAVYNIDSGRQQTVVSQLMRPTRFVLHHPRNVSGISYQQHISVHD